MLRGMYSIPVTRPELDRRDRDAVAAVVDSGWVACGPLVEKLEARFSSYIGRRWGAACHSGAAALSLAFEALGVGPNDEVIVPSLTFTATAAAAARLGATVVFADVTSADDLTLSPRSVAHAMTPRTRAVVFVPYGGYAGSLVPVADVCATAGVPLIEDACHGPGATALECRVGTLGLMSTYSFHSTKNLTSGEGGMVLGDDENLGETVRVLRTHGIVRTPGMAEDGSDYIVARIGHNHRMSDLAAALALAQLERLDECNRARAERSRRYDELLADIPGLECPFAGDRDGGVGHLYPVLLPAGTDRRSVRELLRDRAIETAVHYVPLHTQPAYAGRARVSDVAVTEQVAPRLLTLPLFPSLTDGEQCAVAESLRAALCKPGHRQRGEVCVSVAEGVLA